MLTKYINLSFQFKTFQNVDCFNGLSGKKGICLWMNYTMNFYLLILSSLKMVHIFTGRNWKFTFNDGVSTTILVKDEWLDTKTGFGLILAWLCHLHFYPSINRYYNALILLRFTPSSDNTLHKALFIISHNI